MGVEIVRPRPLLPAQENYGNGITGAESVMRTSVNTSSAITMSNQTLRLAYFTPQVTVPVATAVTAVTTTQAAATPTLCRMGLYAVASNGDLTLVASTANDTALWTPGATFRECPKALSASYTVVAGQRYAAAALCVTGATAPTIAGALRFPSTAVAGYAPKLAAAIASQTDLPASIASGSAATSSDMIWVAFI